MMTGNDAWKIVAPILAAHMIPYMERDEKKLNALDEAYVLVFEALMQYDKRQERRKKA